jgi:hypothetical protein
MREDINFESLEFIDVRYKDLSVEKRKEYRAIAWELKDFEMMWGILTNGVIYTNIVFTAKLDKKLNKKVQQFVSMKNSRGKRK